MSDVLTPLPEAEAAARLAENAAQAARLLRALANERRLLVLCDLVMAGEKSVNDLAANVGLSQSALSQHLALMRDEGLVATRRAGTVIYYRLADPKAEAVLHTLHRLFCGAPDQSGGVSSGG
jgi:ArsR family transcriptional regulator